LKYGFDVGFYEIKNGIIGLYRKPQCGAKISSKEFLKGII